MMRRSTSRLILAAAALSAAACSEPTSPPTWVMIGPTDFVVPAVAAANDTVNITFRYDNSCGGRSVTQRLLDDRLEISVLAEVQHPGMLCPAVIVITTGAARLMPGQHGPDFSVVFRQPSGVDSVRVIRRPATASAR
ncbi:MAG: hypothetical protein C0503_01965 [Gemmatimonas sp.]|nr:hypothetical protein [Gemmatimonas sp.]